MIDSVSKTSETGLLNQSLDYIGDIDELKSQYLFSVRQRSVAWSEKIREIMDQQSYTPQALATLCGVSRSGVVRWLEGSIPGRRDTFIRIGFAAGYDLAEMNKFLQRYGRYNQLYAKSLEDSVYIFVLNSETIPHTYAICQKLLEQVSGCLQQPEDVLEGYFKETGMLNLDLLSLETPDELDRFIRNNWGQYRSAFARFYNKVEEHIEALNWDHSTDRSWANRRIPFSINRLANVQDWSASMRRCVSEIRQRKWFPLRTKIISMGLHLNLKREKIDELLELAYMEPLCAKNPVEGSIIFAVMDADVRGLIPDPKLRDASTNLCEYVREVLEQLELPDTRELIQDLLVEW